MQAEDINEYTLQAEYMSAIPWTIEPVHVPLHTKVD
jgi:hypothetical protein